MTQFSAMLQAGGKSSRMGADKALVPFMGTTLLGYVIDQLRPFCDDIAIISNRPEDYERFQLPIFQDVYPEWGALGGLHAAVYHSKCELCMVLACDMPFIQMDLLLYMVRESQGYDAVIPRLDQSGFTEPFRAVYRQSTLPYIEAAINNGQRRVNSFFDQVSIRFLEQKEIQVFDPALRSFFNVNTPEDLQIARQMARETR